MTWQMEMYRERFNAALNDNLPKELEGWKFKVEEPGDYGSPRCIRYMGQGPDGQIMSFYMQQYSACCAFEQLNHFHYSNNASEKEVHAMIDHVIQVMRRSYRGRFAAKLVLNTVQQNYEEYRSKNGNLTGKTIRGPFYYPHVHSWAIKQSFVIDTPIVNHNTSNIIHHLICFVAE